jgi:hypothetical protein
MGDFFRNWSRLVPEKFWVFASVALSFAFGN